MSIFCVSRRNTCEIVFCECIPCGVGIGFRQPQETKRSANQGCFTRTAGFDSSLFHLIGFTNTRTIQVDLLQSPWRNSAIGDHFGSICISARHKYELELGQLGRPVYRSEEITTCLSCKYRCQIKLQTVLRLRPERKEFHSKCFRFSFKNPCLSLLH